MTQQAQTKPTPTGTHVKPTPPDLFIHHDVCMETRWENLYSRGYLTQPPSSSFATTARHRSSTPRPGASSSRARGRETPRAYL